MKIRIPALMVLLVCALQLPIWAQDASGTPAPQAQTGQAAPATPSICPPEEGVPVTQSAAPVKSEPILLPAPVVKSDIPASTDKIVTPHPSVAGKKVVTPAPVLEAVPLPEAVKAPITQDQALRIAFQYSPELRMALSSVERARGGVGEARARFLPTLTVGATTMMQGPVSEVQFGETTIQLIAPNSTSATASFLLPLDLNRQLSNALDISMYQFQMQYLTMVSASEDLILNVKNSYYNLLRACGQREVAQSAVEVAEARLRNVRAQKAAGVVPQFDVTAAEVDLANLNQQLLSAQNGVLLTQTALNRVMGIDVNNPTQVVAMTPTVSSTPLDIPTDIDQAYARRPEVKMAQTGVTLARTNVRLQSAGLLPTLAVTANAQYAFELSGLSTDNLGWNAGLALSIPILDGGATRARVRQARADVQTAAASLEQMKLGIAQQVRSAALNVENAARRVSTAGQGVTLAQEALRLANIRYEARIAVPVEVTNAEAQLTQARVNYVNAQYDYAVAVAQLERATSTQPELNQLQLLAGAAR